jgi:hypothetical protein
MKKIGIGILLSLLLLSCSSSPSKNDGVGLEQKQGGKSHTVVLTGVLKNDRAGRGFYIMPREEGENFTPKERHCAEEVVRALDLSGFHETKDRKKADLLIGLAFPKTTKASDLTLTALLGGFRHSVSLEARDQRKKLVWTLEAYAESDSEDIQNIFPYIALGMVDHFGKEPTAERVSIDEFDARVARIKGGE